MRAMNALVAVGLVIGLCPSSGHTEDLVAVRAVAGYICMSLTPKDEQVSEQSELPPVFAEPSANSQKLGYPIQIVFVRHPLHEVDGFVEMLRLNGQRGWIEANHLRAWRPMNKTSAKCIPSVMSNGRLGTQIR